MIHLYRIDQNAPERSIRWGISSMGTATFFTEEADLIQKLTEAEEFVVQVHPEGGGAVTAVFDVTGGNEPIGEVLSACGIGIEKVGRQGLWGIETQPVGGISPIGSDTAAPPAAATSTSGYRPSGSWQFRQAGAAFYAIVESASGKSHVSLSCLPGRAGITLTLHSPENWTANVPASLTVDAQVLPMRIEGSEHDVYLGDTSSFFVSDKVVDALSSGQSFALTGPAAERMPEGARYFSLRGSGKAIQQMRAKCGV